MQKENLKKEKSKSNERKPNERTALNSCIVSKQPNKRSLEDSLSQPLTKFMIRKIKWSIDDAPAIRIH